MSWLSQSDPNLFFSATDFREKTKKRPCARFKKTKELVTFTLAAEVYSIPNMSVLKSNTQEPNDHDNYNANNLCPLSHITSYLWDFHALICGNGWYDFSLPIDT